LFYLASNENGILTDMLDDLIFVVDDDAAMRRSIVFLAESVGWSVQAFASAEDFLKQCEPERGSCLILDIRMPTMSGLELQQILKERRSELPIVFITGHGDVAMAVQAMKNGALDFIEKPFKDQQLLDAIAQAVRNSSQRKAQHRHQAEARDLLERLTQREREVALLVARGLSNKLIARELDISDKTVQVHRAHVLEKMGVHSAAQLAQQLMRIERDGGEPPPFT
jgi:FixJ family two-component response regulator